MGSPEIIALVLTGVGLATSIIYYAIILNNANKTQQNQLETRQAQIFLQYVKDWNDVEFKTNAREILRWEWNDFDDFMDKYFNDLDNSGKFTSLGSFFESLGVLVFKGLIDIDLVATVFSGYIMRYWDKYESVEYESRKRFNWPQSGVYFEYLNNEIKRVTYEQYPELQDQELLHV
jgi:hypothetical protein